MNNSLHHMIMADHTLFQKDLLGRIRNTGLTSGQPKVLEYLLSHDGSVQRTGYSLLYRARHAHFRPEWYGKERPDPA